MKPEESARQEIDQHLEQVVWEVQDYRELNLVASLGVAVREFPLKSGSADYLLFVDRKPIGVIEAKSQGTTLSGVAEQTERYITKIEESLPQITAIPPFAYETTGTETFFRDLRDPDPRSRRVFAFHQPKTLNDWLSEEDTLRERLKKMPPLIKTGVRDCQIKAIENLEKSFAEARPKASSGERLFATNIVDTFKRFIEENKDELTAIQLIYQKPYGRRHLTYEEIKQLAESIKKPPYSLTPEVIWQAYEQLEKSRVRGAGPKKLLTNIISLMRFAIGERDVLEPFSDMVDRRFNEWLAQQEALGKRFTQEQMEWLTMIKEHIATSLSIGMEDFELAAFNQKGGAVKVYQLFGEQLNSILEELNERLAA